MSIALAKTAELINQYAIWLYLICILALVFCARAAAVARKERKRTIFKLERETAMARESRALSMAALFSGIIVALTAFKFYVVPSIEALPPAPTPTATLFIFEEPPTREVPTATPTTPPPTATRRPTQTPAPASPTPTAPPRPACAQPGVCIHSPANGAQIKGVVQIKGTANIESFQFYKVEYGLGDKPEAWHSISEVHRKPVIDGLLETWDTAGFPPGVYTLRLTVVDITGNFRPPHEIRVSIVP